MNLKRFVPLLHHPRELLYYCIPVEVALLSKLDLVSELQAGTKCLQAGPEMLWGRGHTTPGPGWVFRLRGALEHRPPSTAETSR